MDNKKRNVKGRILCSLVAILFCWFFIVQSVSGKDLSVHYKLQGFWVFDEANTIKARVENGVPWHVAEVFFGMGGRQVIMEFDFGLFRFYEEKSLVLLETGKYQIYESSEDRVILRVLPDSDWRKANEFKLYELTKFTMFPGDAIPFFYGLKFIDDHTAESFSYVRTFDCEIVEKDDNATWKRFAEKPDLDILLKLKDDEYGSKMGPCMKTK